MTNNPLKSNAVILHCELLDRLILMCQDGELTYTQKLETAVQLSIRSTNDLYQLIAEHGFSNSEEEILFFKSIKPLFVAEREYYQRLYHAQLFGDETAVFWKHELIRMEKLLDEYSEFSFYYHHNATENDAAWFSQGQAPLPTTLCMLPSETDPRHTSARDGWISGLLAVERYRDWLAAKYKQVESRS